MRFVTLARSSALAALASALPLLGGGFYLEVYSPTSSSEVQAKGAALVVQLTGCHRAEDGRLTATAEGLVNGKRTSVQLLVTRLGQPGAFAIAQQWPSDGKWVVHLRGTNSLVGASREAAVPVQGGIAKPNSTLAGDVGVHLQAELIERMLH